MSGVPWIEKTRLAVRLVLLLLLAVSYPLLLPHETTLTFVSPLLLEQLNTSLSYLYLLHPHLPPIPRDINNDFAYTDL